MEDFAKWFFVALCFIVGLSMFSSVVGSLVGS